MQRRHIPLLPTSPAAFALHLELAEDGEAEDPFVRLDRAGGKTRTYLGSLRSAAGAEMARVVIQVPPHQLVGDGSSPLGRVADEWERRREDRSRLAETAADLFPQQLLPGSGPGEWARLEPLVYCRTHRRLYPIPGPRNLQPLQTCRDDRLLVEQGMPTFSGAEVPLLVESGEGIGSEAPRFFVAAETAPPELAQKGVLGLAELRSELAETLAERARADPDLDLEAFPAVSPPATKSSVAPWFVLTEYDVPYLVASCEPWSFDRFVDYLGGRDVGPDVGRSTAEENSEAGERSGGFLFALEGSGLDAIEILVLKLTLFEQVVESIDQYYRVLGPHLDLHPGHLVVHTPSIASPGLPVRWSFRARLLGLSSARRTLFPQGVEQVSPPPRPRRPYASRALREAALIEIRDGELVIDQLLEETREEGPRVVVKGRLRDPNGIFPEPKSGDLLLVHWPHQFFGRAHFTTTARIDPEASTSNAELVFFTEPLELSAEVAQRLESAASTELRGGRYRLLPRLHVVDDLHALGVLLLRLLLVNDGQSLSTFEPLLAEIPDLIAEPAGSGGFGFEQRLEDSLANALEEHLERLAPNNVFYVREDRLAGRANAIPQELWQEILRLAWRLVARGPGFGLGPGGSFDESHPASHLEKLAQEVRGILRRLRLVLFRRQGVHVEVHSMIAEMMAGLTTSD